MMGLAQQGLEYIPPLILTIFQVYTSAGHRRGYQFTPFPEALVLLPGGPSEGTPRLSSRTLRTTGIHHL